MDYQDILLRYLGRLVTITTFGYIKIWGEVAEVNGDHVRLVNTLVTTEHDDQGWYSQIQHSDPDSSSGPRNAETIIQFHQIVAISCQDSIHPDAAPYGRDAEKGVLRQQAEEDPGREKTLVEMRRGRKQQGKDGSGDEERQLAGESRRHAQNRGTQSGR